jgi:hypothetical protein
MKAGSDGLTWADRHRGPYTLIGTRMLKTKPDEVKESVTLATGLAFDEVEELALGFMTDPRDTLSSTVEVWSEREEQFVTVIRKGDL